MTESFIVFKNRVHRISKYCEKLDNFMVKGRNKVSQILKNNKTKIRKFSKTKESKTL